MLPLPSTNRDAFVVIFTSTVPSLLAVILPTLICSQVPDPGTNISTTCEMPEELPCDSTTTFIALGVKCGESPSMRARIG